MRRWVATIAMALLPAALGAQQYRVADSIIESGIRRGIYPRAVLVVGGGAGLRHHRG